ncbi:hypothetical protein BDB00DRAFT_932066 [Zychaea mexicana]|uniref:uncharacterized protein n=1 Tax=Zychaea mexicana TaxID=64656 RepID=UPI0022FDC1F8|nr:uncharacterized protein BDB00DRAFT_932066 [Zychaea mexicana]KAI9489296.1 hypothetical protein BDB00DRAFT_932066 [Zychaea mexicana]
MKTSQFVSTTVEHFPENGICHNVAYEKQKTDKDYTIEPRIALHLCKDLLIHAQLAENNTTLELRPHTLTDSLQTTLPVKIVYSSPIVSTIVLNDDGDNALYCWLISQDNQIIRHRFALNTLFTDESAEPQVIVRRLTNKYISLSATPHGLATVSFSDGSIVHYQEDKPPSSSYELDIVDKDPKLCSYMMHGSTSFPLLKYLNIATRRLLNWNIDVEGSSTQARTTVLASSPKADIIAGVRRDHRIVTWTWANGGLDRTLLELPQFNNNGKLVDPEDQDMTYQLPGSFTPKHLAKKGEFQQKDDHSYDVKILSQSDDTKSHKAIAYVDTQSEPFFALYDVKESNVAVLSNVIMTPRHLAGEFLGFDASLEKKNKLRLWTIWQEAKTVFVMSSTIELVAGDQAPHISRPNWTTDSFSSTTNHRATIATYIVDKKDLLVGISNELRTVRHLDKLEDVYFHHGEATAGDNDDDRVAKALATLSSMLISIYPHARSNLETALRDSFSKPYNAANFYKTHFESNQALNVLTTFPEIDKPTAASLVQLINENQPDFQHTRAGKTTSALVIEAVANIITNRYDLFFSLFLVLCGDKAFQSEASTTWELLRNLDSLRWMPRHVFERLVEPIVVPTDARLDIGSAAYYALSKTGDVIENCDALAKTGEAGVALDMARIFLDMEGGDGQGEKAEMLRAVKFRSSLASQDFDNAISILSRMTEDNEKDTLIECLLDAAYNEEKYQVISKLSLRPTIVGKIIRDRANKQQSPISKRLSWWQVGYSYFTFAKDDESAKECMREHLKLVGSTDELLKQFFA